MDSNRMSDFREAVADGLERAADRMYNSGFLDEERRYRDAATRIRAGLSLEETQALERRMLTDPQAALLHRLSALAAQGEYDSPDPVVLTDIESSANQSLSPAATSQTVDPYTDVVGPENLDPFTGVIPQTNEGPPNTSGPASAGGLQYVGWSYQNGFLYEIYQGDDGQLYSYPFSGPMPKGFQQQTPPAPQAQPSPPPSPAPSQPTNLLNIAMQEAVGPYNPTAVTPASFNISDVLAGSDWASLLNNSVTPVSNISDVLAGSDWASSLNPQNSSPAPLSNDQPGALAQILSGTYAESVLQVQLMNQGQVPGSFVSPVPPNDYLFNPNATSLAGATLLGSHSPNTEVLQAQQMELAASMFPVVGAVSTWMHPHSSSFAKGIAVVGAVASVLPLVSELTELGNLPELGSLSTEENAFYVSHNPKFYGQGAANATEIESTLGGRGVYQLVGDHPPDLPGQTVVRVGEGDMLVRYASHAHGLDQRIWRGFQVIANDEGLSQRLSLEGDIGLSEDLLLSGEPSSLYKLLGNFSLGDFAEAGYNVPRFTLLNPALYPSARLR
jgi:hypothetical protein